MPFDTKVAILVLHDLAVWQKLNVTAFLATGIAAAAPQAMGEPYEDAAGRAHAPLLGQPMLVFAATADNLQRAFRVGLERNLTRAVSSASRCMGPRRTSIARRRVARCIRETAWPREIN